VTIDNVRDLFFLDTVYYTCLSVWCIIVFVLTCAPD